MQVSNAQLSEMLDGKKWKGPKSLAMLVYVLVFCDGVALLSGNKYYRGESGDSLKRLIWYGFTLQQVARMYKKGVKVADLEHLSLPQSAIGEILGTDSNPDCTEDIENWRVEFQRQKPWKTVGNVVYLFPNAR